jgi:hypothetical protein
MLSPTCDASNGANVIVNLLNGRAEVIVSQVNLPVDLTYLTNHAKNISAKTDIFNKTFWLNLYDIYKYACVKKL